MSNMFEKHQLKTVREDDNTNSISYSAKKLSKISKFEMLKLILVPSETYMHISNFVYIMSAKFEKHQLKTVRGADCTPQTIQCKKLP